MKKKDDLMKGTHPLRGTRIGVKYPAAMHIVNYLWKAQ